MKEFWLSYNAMPERTRILIQPHRPAEPIIQHHRPSAEHESEEVIVEVVPPAPVSRVPSSRASHCNWSREEPSPLCAFEPLTHRAHEHNKVLLFYTIKL